MFLYLWLFIFICPVWSTPPACFLDCISVVSRSCNNLSDIPCLCSSQDCLIPCFEKRCKDIAFLSARDHYWGTCLEHHYPSRNDCRIPASNVLESTIDVLPNDDEKKQTSTEQNIRESAGVEESSSAKKDPESRGELIQSSNESYLESREVDENSQPDSRPAESVQQESSSMLSYTVSDFDAPVLFASVSSGTMFSSQAHTSGTFSSAPVFNRRKKYRANYSRPVYRA